MSDFIRDENGLSGQTPLSEEEKEGLIPRHISLKSELNEWEEKNIQDAMTQVFRRKTGASRLLTVEFIKALHKKMFLNVWKWAGRFRESDKNIGVPWFNITEECKKLCDDALFWISHGSYEADELASRFHHRLVNIHPFPNGNGRHARLLTDLLLKALEMEPFTWGRQNLIHPSKTREAYINALKKADENDFRELIAFVRS